jgi:hypothetical protein
MIVIRVGRNAIRLTFCFVLFMMAIFLLGSIIESNSKVSVKTFLSAARLLDEDKKIEIFDISEGKVVAQIRPSNVIRDEAGSFLEKITGMYGRVKALPDTGQIIRIPFDPVIKAKSKWITDCGITSINELYILFPNPGKPYLLILDEDDKPWFFNFNADTSILHPVAIPEKFLLAALFPA